ncbi:MAG: hypothetical protein U0794_14285 [Isosphaeraceae bacterium]
MIDLMLMVAGLAVGVWLILPEIRPDAVATIGSVQDVVMLGSVGLLGGLALVGPPLLLWRRRRSVPWGSGRILWFATGTSAWLLWPPIVMRRINGGRFGDADTGICFAYGTPLMAVYVTASLLAGGWLRKSRRRRIWRSWHETFGLLLGLAWACTGLYVLANLYRSNR